MAGSAIPLAQGAKAQGFFGYWDEPVKKRKKPAARRSQPVTADKQDKSTKIETVTPKGPLVLSVSLAKQRIVVFDGTDAIAEAPISSGKIGHATPTGIFTVIEKKRRHFSNLYHGAPMPNMQRITWSGVALHAGQLPGYPASHGCIRLPHGFSQKLFGMTKMGTRVIVSRDMARPELFSHERLFRAYPPENELVVASAAPAGQSSFVADALGVSVAAAADGTVEAARLTYRERRRLEAERITAEIREAGYKKTAAWMALSAVAKEADAARQPFIEARVEIARLTSEARKAEGALKAAQAELDRLSKRIERRPQLERDAKTRAKREELETSLASLGQAADAADRAMKAAIDQARPLEEQAQAGDAKRRAAINAYSVASQELAQALGKEEDMRRREAKRAAPVSVFISRKTQKLYVRQGYTPMMEVPVTIDRPEEEIGSHVYTALDFAPGKREMLWSVVSVPSSGKDRAQTEKSKRKKGQPEEVAEAPRASRTPAAALDRITIPQEARDYIEDVMKPGSSLIVSDNGIGNETGQYTDFIIATR